MKLLKKGQVDSTSARRVSQHTAEDRGRRMPDPVREALAMHDAGDDVGKRRAQRQWYELAKQQLASL